jgi:hypothetical protein
MIWDREKCFFSEAEKWFHHFDLWCLSMAAMPPTTGLSSQSPSPYHLFHSSLIELCLRTIWWCLKLSPARLGNCWACCCLVVGDHRFVVRAGAWNVDAGKTSLAATCRRWSQQAGHHTLGCTLGGPQSRLDSHPGPWSQACCQGERRFHGPGSCFKCPSIATKCRCTPGKMDSRATSRGKMYLSLSTTCILISNLLK